MCEIEDAHCPVASNRRLLFLSPYRAVQGRTIENPHAHFDYPPARTDGLAERDSRSYNDLAVDEWSYPTKAGLYVRVRRKGVDSESGCAVTL